MNAAAPHLERAIADGKEPRKFLGQSVGYENELIGQTNFPHQPSSRRLPRAAILTSPAGPPRTSWNRPGPPPPGRNMPSTRGIRQGGKLGRPPLGQGHECAISRIVRTA